MFKKIDRLLGELRRLRGHFQARFEMLKDPKEQAVLWCFQIDRRSRITSYLPACSGIEGQATPFLALVVAF